jgi:hypothetical protein
MAARLCSLCASLEFYLFYNELIEASVPPAIAEFL